MKKTKLKVLDTIKFIDIDKKAIDLSTWKYLMNFHVIYRDELLREHLINVHEAVEENTNKVMRSHLDGLKKEIAKLSKLANKHDAAYIRFI